MATWDKIADDVIAGVYDIKTVGFKRLSDSATIPTKAHASDSGFDLFASEDVIIEPGETSIVPTGIAVELPEGFEAQVRPRSGVTAKTKLRVQLGTIDNGYTGEIGVIVDNTNEPQMAIKRIWTIDHDYGVDGACNIKTLKGGTFVLIRKGDRIAQLVVQALPQFESVEITGFSDDSERGEGGFGSTGV